MGVLFNHIITCRHRVLRWVRPIAQSSDKRMWAKHHHRQRNTKVVIWRRWRLLFVFMMMTRAQILSSIKTNWHAFSPEFRRRQKNLLLARVHLALVNLFRNWMTPLLRTITEYYSRGRGAKERNPECSSSLNSPRKETRHLTHGLASKRLNRLYSESL